MKTFYVILIAIIFSSCNPSGKGSNAEATKANKLAYNKDTLKHDAVPKLSQIKNFPFNTNNLFGIWASDPKGPHADFQLTKDSYFVVDYDGDGNIPYTINGDTIIVFLTPAGVRGKINKLTSDSLSISWEGIARTDYVHWTQ